MSKARRAVSPREPQPPGLRERKKAELKRRIADTAIQLMRESGYEAVTVEEIVRRVEVSQPTFYKYYPSKEAILIEYAMDGFGPVLATAMQQTGGVTDRMRRFLQELAKRMTKDRALWVAIALSNAYNPIREPGLLESSTASTRIVEAVIAHGQETGELTREFPASRLASALEGIVFRLCLEWGANYPRPHSLAKSLDEGFALFVRMARADPKRR